MNAQERRVNEAIKNGGFYGRNGLWNSIKKLNGDPRLYRERVETIIIRNNKEVYCKKKPNGEYFLPGGSTEKGRTNKEQAIAECREETHMNISDVEFSGITYKKYFKPKQWMLDECDILWDGSINYIFVGQYSSKYKGNVAKLDEDPFMRSGRWYPIKECYKFFRKEHKDALFQYIKNHSIDNEDEEITESYELNYFKNKRLLRKISKTKDIDRGAVEQMLSTIKKEYSKLSNTSKIKRERRTADVSKIFHPILTFNFPDGAEITIVLCFDDNEFSPGAAIHTDQYGDVIIIYPVFFKSDKEDQIFTILHEIGHIRLRHVEDRNVKKVLDIDITTDHRLKLMEKGKVMYTELNADLYAVLNGATMYSIINSSVDKDYDKEHDYRFTNNEIANRYVYVFNQYRKLKKHNMYESELSNDYDITCMALTEMVYDNEKTEELTESEKDDLYSILYEYVINSHIKDDEDIQEAEDSFKQVMESCKEYDLYLAESGFDANEILSNRNYNELNSEKKEIIPVLLKNKDDLDKSFNTLEHLKRVKYKSPVIFNNDENKYKCSPKVSIIIAKKKDIKDYANNILLNIRQQLNNKDENNNRVCYFKRIIGQVI